MYVWYKIGILLWYCIQATVVDAELEGAVPFTYEADR